MTTDIKHLSNSDQQREAEKVILARLGEQRGWHLEQGHRMSGMQPDGVDTENRVLVEVYSRIGKLPPGPQRKLAKDILKLNRLNRLNGEEWSLVMAFASEEAAAFLLGNGWVAEEVRAFGIEVVVVDLPAEKREALLAAQVRQAKGISQ